MWALRDWQNRFQTTIFRGHRIFVRMMILKLVFQNAIFSFASSTTESMHIEMQRQNYFWVVSEMRLKQCQVDLLLLVKIENFSHSIFISCCYATYHYQSLGYEKLIVLWRYLSALPTWHLTQEFVSHLEHLVINLWTLLQFKRLIKFWKKRLTWQLTQVAPPSRFYDHICEFFSSQLQCLLIRTTNNF